ncbi:unnamed protein product [Camellia sinensis]
MLKSIISTTTKDFSWKDSGHCGEICCGHLPSDYLLFGNDKQKKSHAILRYLACAFPGVADHCWYPSDLFKRSKIESVLDWHHSNLRRGTAAAEGEWLWIRLVVIPLFSQCHISNNLIHFHLKRFTFQRKRRTRTRRTNKVIAFSDEEAVRFQSTFLLIGCNAACSK